MSDALYTFTSHIDGKNAKVSIYSDRLEWHRSGLSGGRVVGAALTFGVSAAVGGLKHKGSEMIPIKQITGVQTKKGMTQTTVQVMTAGKPMEFRISHREAEVVKATLNRLILGEPVAPVAPVEAAPVAAAPVDIPAQLQQLKALFDAGVLTQDEYDAKKTDLLSRM